MATTTSITTTYAGEHKNQIISAALLSGNTLANGGVTIKPNIVGKEVVRRLETDGLIRGGTCDFTDTSTVTSTERIIQPKEFQVNLELCKKIGLMIGLVFKQGIVVLEICHLLSNLILSSMLLQK